jgi:hypothetical protein
MSQASTTSVDAKLMFETSKVAGTGVEGPSNTSCAMKKDCETEVSKDLEQDNLVRVLPAPISGIFSTIFFTWLNSIVNLGYRRNREGKGLEPEDLWELRPAFQGQSVKRSFELYWQQEQLKEKPSIANALWMMTSPLILTSVMFELVRIVASFANPLILKVPGSLKLFLELS